MLFPDILIPGYTYNEDANLYLTYTVLFIFFIGLAIGINTISKRYTKRSMEGNVSTQQESIQSTIQQSTINNEKNLDFCSKCGAEILDKTGDFCSKCGAHIK